MNKLPTTWAEFCKLTGRKSKDLPDVSALDKRTGRRVLADFKLGLIIAYCNENKKPDYTDTNQWKYEPWFKVITDKKHPHGCGLSYYYYYSRGTGTNCGPRLCFLSLDALKHVVKHFIKLYCDLYLF